MKNEREGERGREREGGRERERERDHYKLEVVDFSISEDLK